LVESRTWQKRLVKIEDSKTGEGDRLALQVIRVALEDRGIRDGGMVKRGEDSIWRARVPAAMGLWLEAEAGDAKRLTKSGELPTLESRCRLSRSKLTYAYNENGSRVIKINGT
jgi:uncharacterized protein YaeQ